MRRILVLLVIVGAASAAVLHRPLDARASCAAPPALTTAAAAFVGTVTNVTNGGRVATVHVDDIWRGRNVPATVQVVGTPDLAAAATSVDRSYEAGVQYLFAPAGGGPDTFDDNSCTLTQPYSASLAALRPQDAPGAPAPPSQAGGHLVLISLLAAGLATVSGAALALRHRRRPLAPSAPRGC